MSCQYLELNYIRKFPGIIEMQVCVIYMPRGSKQFLWQPSPKLQINSISNYIRKFPGIIDMPVCTRLSATWKALPLASNEMRRRKSHEHPDSILIQNGY